MRLAGTTLSLRGTAQLTHYWCPGATIFGNQSLKPRYPLLPCLSANRGSREGSAPFWTSSCYLNSKPGNPHSAWAQEGCRAAKQGLLGAGALTAPLTPAASFLSPGHQTVNGNECLVGESGAATVGVAA